MPISELLNFIEIEASETKPEPLLKTPVGERAIEVIVPNPKSLWLICNPSFKSSTTTGSIACTLFDISVFLLYFLFFAIRLRYCSTVSWPLIPCGAFLDISLNLSLPLVAIASCSEIDSNSLAINMSCLLGSVIPLTMLSKGLLKAPLASKLLSLDTEDSAPASFIAKASGNQTPTGCCPMTVSSILWSNLLVIKDANS